MLVAVRAGHADLLPFARHELVGAEVVLEALDEHGRHVGDVLRVAPDVVALQHGDDLVVGLAAVDELQPADDPRGDEDLRLRDRPLAEHADVQRIAVAAAGHRRELRHPLRAIRLRHEAVQRRRLRRRALRPVDLQIARGLVDLVLDQVERRDLDEHIDHARRIAPGRAMPRVRTPRAN